MNDPFKPGGRVVEEARRGRGGGSSESRDSGKAEKTHLERGNKPGLKFFGMKFDLTNRRHQMSSFFREARRWDIQCWKGSPHLNISLCTFELEL